MEAGISIRCSDSAGATWPANGHLFGRSENLNITGLCVVHSMIHVPYGYARVSKSDRDNRKLEPRLRELVQCGLHGDLIFVADDNGTTLKL